MAIPFLKPINIEFLLLPLGDAKITANLIRPQLICGFYGIMDCLTYTIAKASYDMFLKY
jgi:hypothetical protein